MTTACVPRLSAAFWHGGKFMSEATTVSNRFWREFKAEVANTLSSAQRGEIERVLGISSAMPATTNGPGDIRLSCKWFFVRLLWGPEKRSAERVAQEQAMHPVMARRNLPMLMSLFTGYMAFWIGVMALSVLVFYYLFA